MSRPLFLAVVVGLAISSVAQSPPPPPAPSEHAKKQHDVSGIQNRQSQPDYSPSPASATSIHQPTSPPAQRAPTTKSGVGNDSSTVNWASLWNIINTVLLTIFTGILAGVAFYQYRLTHRQADSALITDRAFVLIDSVVLNTTGLEYTSLVLFTLKNFGRTIAHSVELTGELVMSERAMLSNQSDETRQWTLDQTPPTTIAPPGTNTWLTKYIGKFIDSDETIKTIEADLITLQYSVDVTYTDAFQKKPHRYHCEGRYVPLLKAFIITSSTSD